MSNVDISQVLNQMRVMAAQAQGKTEPATASSENVDFSNLLKQSIDTVNKNQKTAGQLTEKFQAGDPDTNLAQVMIALQKSSVSFEAMKQVRNKLVDAYQEIMRMQV
jgi:flagellar hook-basal body complex protein FliE